MKQQRIATAASPASDESLVFTVVDNILVCNIHIDSGNNYFDRLSKAVTSILECEPYQGVVLDMSSLPLLDHFSYPAISKLVAVISLMGRCCVISGISPGVAAFLAERDIEVEKLVTAGNTDKALHKIRLSISPGERKSPDDDKVNQNATRTGASLDETEHS